MERVEQLLSRGADLAALDREHETTPLVRAQTVLQMTGNEASDAAVPRLKGKRRI